LRHFISRLDDHLTDEQTASLLCDEMALADRLIAKQHLAKCRQCRVRKEDLEGRRADQMISLYREVIENEEQWLSAGPRIDFARALRLQIGQAPLRRGWVLRLPRFVLSELALLSPVFISCMFLTLGSVGFFFWWQQHVPDISSNALLARAAQWDTRSLAAPNTVVFQRVRIIVPDQRMERSIYRDTQGKHTLKTVKLAVKEDRVKSTLMRAGLDWDEPIAVSSYQGWRDRQPVHKDRIVRAGSHLLTLTTTVPDGSISEQSLTVRDTDFHPVRRTVAFRDSETIEIAELDYRILPWSAVDARVFQPLGDALSDQTTSTSHAGLLPRMAEEVTEGQLDETELEARLVLNKLGADTGEQIEISQTPRGVEVRGLVDTEERKHLLQKQLSIVPHLTVSIQSMADIKDNLAVPRVAGNINVAELPDEKSPIEKYLATSGRSVTAINALTHRLFENTLTISQESKAIHDLQSRFVAGAPKTIIASATLMELVYSHQQRLQAALKQERELLTEVRGTSASYDGTPTLSTPVVPLVDAGSRLLALCQELTQTNNSSTRSADRILADMSSSVEALRLDVHEAYAKPRQGESPLNGKR